MTQRSRSTLRITTNCVVVLNVVRVVVRVMVGVMVGVEVEVGLEVKVWSRLIQCDKWPMAYATVPDRM